MNCERCQELISDLVDGSLSREESATLNLHLGECFQCAEVRRDLESVVGFCRANRGQYDAVPNERALWLRIRNTIEVADRANTISPREKGGWLAFLSRSWQLSFPQLAASVAALVLIVSLVTVVAIRRSDTGGGLGTTSVSDSHPKFVLNDRKWQQQQTINYWNTRIAANRASWSPEMRDTFDRNLSVFDQEVNDSLKELDKNPHDEVSEEMLNAALNGKIALLKDFAELE
jgi:hypothetical protein